MVVRKMTLQDVSQVYQISYDCFSEPWSLESIKKEVDNTVAEYLVAESTEGVIGYAGLWHVLDEGEIINIAVAPKWRRNKIGEQLLKNLIKKAKDYALEVIHLEVRESNNAARALYEKFGFYEIAKRKNYYHKPTEDAIIMEWKEKEA